MHNPADDPAAATGGSVPACCNKSKSGLLRLRSGSVAMQPLVAGTPKQSQLRGP
jgi:hypothetical protein